MTFINIVIEGNVRSKLAKLQALLDPAAVGVFLNEAIEKQINIRARQRFQSEGDDASGKWAPLSPGTQNIRESMQYGAAHPINVRTGELRDFIENGDARIAIEPSAATLTLPSSVPSGNLGKKFKGAQQGEGTAPARPVLALGATDLAQTVTALEQYIRSGTGVL